LASLHGFKRANKYPHPLKKKQKQNKKIAFDWLLITIAQGRVAFKISKIIIIIICTLCCSIFSCLLVGMMRR
jgi:hypothetical protein